MKDSYTQCSGSYMRNFIASQQFCRKAVEIFCCANAVVVRPAVQIPNVNNVAAAILKIATVLILVSKV